MDETFASKLVDAIEKLYIENRVYKSLLKSFANRLPPQQEIDRVVAAGREHIREQVQKQFSPVRDRIRSDSNLEQVLQEFLKVVPPKKDVN